MLKSNNNLVKKKQKNILQSHAAQKICFIFHNTLRSKKRPIFAYNSNLSGPDKIKLGFYCNAGSYRHRSMSDSPYLMGICKQAGPVHIKIIFIQQTTIFLINCYIMRPLFSEKKNTQYY